MTLLSKVRSPVQTVLVVTTPSTTVYVPPSQLKVVVAALAAGAKTILPNKPAMSEKEIAAITAGLGFFFQVKSVNAGEMQIDNTFLNLSSRVMFIIVKK